MVKNFSVENGAVYIYVARDYRCTLDDTSSLFMCLWIRDQEAKATLDHLMLILVASGGLACIFSFDIPRLYQFMSNPIGQLREQLCETGLKISEIALPTTGTTVNQNEANLRLLLQDSLCSVELTCGPSYDLDQNRSVFFVAINFAWFPFGRLVRGRLIGKLDRLLKALGGRPIKREYYDLLKHRSKRILK